MKNHRRVDIISCPVCGAQYTAGEIYLPKKFLGVPKNIERDINKHILHDFGDPMNTKESYICDKCNSPFTVKASVKFLVEEDVKHNISSKYYTQLKTSSIFLKED